LRVNAPEGFTPKNADVASNGLRRVRQGGHERPNQMTAIMIQQLDSHHETEPEKLH
jgi:hypothetical protein